MRKEHSTFEQTFKKWNWKPIRHCPGRFIFSEGASFLPPAEIIGLQLQVLEFKTTVVPDKVLVMKFNDGGGLISYAKDDDKFLHTLNNDEGFRRKLEHLQIMV